MSFPQPILSLVQLVGDVLQIRVECGESPHSDIDAALPISSKCQLYVLSPMSTARKMLVICVLQIPAVGVAESPESPPGCTADCVAVGGHGCRGVVR